MTPDQLLFESDLSSAAYLTGVAAGLWGHVSDDARVAWPQVLFWLRAAPRSNSPDRYFVLADAAGYRHDPPTGTFVDPVTLEQLAADRRPKGRPNSRFAKVFRTDWKLGAVFYHPYDRVARNEHPKWPQEMPHLVWTSDHTVADYLDAWHALLQSEDYTGV